MEALLQLGDAAIAEVRLSQCVLKRDYMFCFLAARQRERAVGLAWAVFGIASSCAGRRVDCCGARAAYEHRACSQAVPHTQHACAMDGGARVCSQIVTSVPFPVHIAYLSWQRLCRQDWTSGDHGWYTAPPPDSHVLPTHKQPI